MTASLVDSTTTTDRVLFHADDKPVCAANQSETLCILFAVRLLVDDRLGKRPINECMPLPVGLQLLLGLVNDIR